MKLIATLFVFTYSIAFDALNKILELGLSTARQSFLSFILLMVEHFCEEYFRTRNESNLIRILKIMEATGIPGCVDSQDCQH